MSAWTAAYEQACADAGVTPRAAAQTLQHGGKLCIAGNSPVHFHHRVDDAELTAVLLRAAARSRAVCELHLPYNVVTTRGLQLLAQAMCSSTLAHVTVIDVSYNNIHDARDALSTLADACERDDCALHTLCCAGNALGDCDDSSSSDRASSCGVALARMLRASRTLTWLDLHHTHLDMTALLHICDALATNRTLVSLDLGRPLLRGCEEVKYVVHHLTLAMRRNDTLTRLCLDHFALTDHDLQVLLPALCTSAVVTLSLRGNALSPDAGEWLGRLLDRKADMRALDLCHNRLCGGGACALATHVAGHASLRALYLAHNSIDAHGVACVVRAVCACPTLQSLSLWGNAVAEDDAVTQLHHSAARLRALRDVDVALYTVDGQAAVYRA